MRRNRLRIRAVVAVLIGGMLLAQLEATADNPERYIGPKPACVTGERC
jgi:hypothetical protein